MPEPAPATPAPPARAPAGRACRWSFAALAAGALGASLVAAPPVATGLLLAGGGLLQVDWGHRRGAQAGGVLVALCGLTDLVGGGLLCLGLSPRPAIPGLILASFLIGGGLVRLNGAALARFPGRSRQAAVGALAVAAGLLSLLAWPGGADRPLAAAVATLLAGLAWSAAPPADQRTST